MSETPPQAVSAGRGLLYITAAKLWFMVGGATINFALPWLFHSKERYGEWTNVVSVVSALNNVMVTATIQGVAKFAARGPRYVEGARRAALRLQLVVGGLVAVAYLLAAPIIASLERDPAMTSGLRLSSGVVLAYAFYAVFVGAANGARQFQKQAGLDLAFTTLRALLVCGAAVAFSSVVAAMGGFVVAAVTILVLSMFVVRGGRLEEPTSPRELAAFMLPVAGYLLLQNCLMFVDGWVLKPVVAAAAAGGLDEAARAGNAAVGIYGAVQNVARLPYQAILSVTFVIFPLVSAATFAADRERTRGYVEKSLRLSLLLLGLLATGAAAAAEGILSLFPRGEYLPGATALALLVFGYVLFALLSISGTILNGAGFTGLTMLIGAGTLALDAALSWALVRYAVADGHDPLRFAALGTTVSIGLGVAAALAALRRTVGASLPGRSLARATIAAGLGLGVARLVPLHGRLGLAAGVVGGLVYLAVLFASRELSLAELRALRRGGGAARAG